jgi:RNA polymerase sigma factor (sigma-70 family)
VVLPPFQQLLDAHGRDVHRFLVASVGRIDADDCYQETWLSALRAYPRLRDASNLKSWLLTIAHHKVIDHARRAKRVPVPAGDLPEPAAGAGAGAGLPVGASASRFTAAPDALPDEELWAAVKQLPPKQRTAVALRFVLDADYSLIAGTMETSEDAARRNVHEGLKRLRTEYTP